MIPSEIAAQKAAEEQAHSHLRLDMAGAFMDPHPQGRYVTYDAYMARERAHKATLERAETAWRREIIARSREQYEAGLEAAQKAIEKVLGESARAQRLAIVRAMEHERMR
jgi:hypothetical protein